MAGYGTSLQCDQAFDPLMRSLMVAAQRRAKVLDLRMHYRRHDGEGESDWEIQVDGNGYRIAAWSQWLARDLPVVAEGYVGPGQGRQSIHFATSFVARWTGWCVGDEERTAVSARGSDPGLWYWPVIEVPDPPDPLEPRLRISDDVIARWMANDLPEEIAIEELHTAVEGLLRSVCGKGDWRVLLSKAEQADLLNDSERETLASFNGQYRKQLKHRSLFLGDRDRIRAKGAMYDVIQICERLLSRLQILTSHEGNSTSD